MLKITLVGAGSYEFTRNLVRDFMTYPALAEAEIMLYDIHEGRLMQAKKTVEAIGEKLGVKANIKATTDKKTAYTGANAVTCAIAVGDREQAIANAEYLYENKVDFFNGDTLGIPSIFLYLKTIPTMMSIIKDIETYCPNAWFLNYTNPMSMLCRTMQELSPVRTVGLCHSVQGTTKQMARWIGVPYDEITYQCFGINHQAWVLDFKHQDQNAYPRLLKAIQNSEDIYMEEIVRNEMFFHLGWYVTEGSGHNSCYNPWFRKRPELVEKYCERGRGIHPGASARTTRERWGARSEGRDESFASWADDPANLERSHEYAGGILNATIGDGTPFRFHGNIPNIGLIENLPHGNCVEVPIYASRDLWSPVALGKLPAPLAALNGANTNFQEMIVQGYLHEDPEIILKACYFDQLTAAVLDLSEIKAVATEMFRRNKEHMPDFMANADKL